MRRLATILRLEAGDRRLLLRAAALVLLLRLALWLLPFRTVRRLLAFRPEARTACDDTCIRRVGWAVERVSRFVPGATCLPQALAAEWLLRGLGQPTQLRIGVAKDGGDRLRAHAWVESGGRIVVGRLSNLSSYTVLTEPARHLP